MKEILVLGIGNRLMADDGIGVYVVEELKRRNSNPKIFYLVGETDFYFCLNEMKEALYTIIVDAAYLGNKPGTISIISFQHVSRNCIQSISVHESHLLNDIKGIEGMLICIEPYEINYCISLSSTLQEQFLKIVEKTESIISSIKI